MPVTIISVEAAALQLRKAREELREDLHLVRDLTAIYEGKATMAPPQAAAMAEAIRSAIEVAAISAATYSKAATEFKMSKGSP